MTDIIMGGVLQSACFGLMTYEEAMTNEEYSEWKKQRKEGYRREFYASLTEEEKRKRQLSKTHKLFNELRQQWFKVKCSGQCMDFNCAKCVDLRAPLKEELDTLSLYIQNLETPV